MTYNEYKKQMDELNQEIAVYEEQKEQLQEELSVLSKDKDSLDQEQENLWYEQKSIEGKRELLRQVAEFKRIFILAIVILVLNCFISFVPPIASIMNLEAPIFMKLFPISIEAIIVSVSGGALLNLSKFLKTFDNVDINREDAIKQELYASEEKIKQKKEDFTVLEKKQEKIDEKLSHLYERKNFLDEITMKNLMKHYEKEGYDLDTPEQHEEKPKTMIK